MNAIYTSGDYHHKYLSGDTGNLSEEKIEECRMKHEFNRSNVAMASASNAKAKVGVKNGGGAKAQKAYMRRRTESGNVSCMKTFEMMSDQFEEMMEKLSTYQKKCLDMYLENNNKKWTTVR